MDSAAGRMLWGSNPGSGKRFFSSSKVRLSLGPTHPSVQWVLRFFLEVKWPGPIVNHSPSSSAKVENAWSYTSAPPVPL
jgi:hypothetical protein